MIEWGAIAIAVIGSFSVSEIIHLFTIRETKKGMKIENKQKEDERWEHLTDQLQDQIERLQLQIEKKDEGLTKKDERIIELEDRCADLRIKLDEANTNLAKASLLKCNRLNCPDRKPPLGYAELTPDELMVEKILDKQD